MGEYRPDVICAKKDCRMLSSKDVANLPEYKYRRTSVIVTLDHLYLTPVDIQQIMECGMNVTRFKMSHAPLGDKIKLLKKIEKAALACCKKYDVVEWPIATCIELRTCNIMTGLLEKNVEAILIQENTELVLTCNFELYHKCNENLIFIDNYNLTQDIAIGTKLSIDAVEITMICTDIIDDKNVRCTVTKGGYLKDMAFVCARGVKYNKPYVSKRDLDLVKFAVEHEVDMITINYTRHADTVKQIKEHMKELNVKQRPLIFSTICTEEGLENIDDIIQVADGILLGREFLPYELSESLSNRLGTIRQWLSAKCQRVGKPFFVSGGVLNRALRTGDLLLNEIFDVANSIMDGVTGFVLKGCSHTQRVMQAIKTINDVCKSVEPLSNNKKAFWRIVNEMRMPLNAAEACALAAVTIANQANAHVIVITSVTGDTIRMLLKLRPASILITVSRNRRVTRFLRVYRCTVPLFYSEYHPKMDYQETVDHRVQYAVEYAVKRGWLAYDDMYVTLQRGAELCSYCDTVMVFKCMLSKKQLVVCPEDGLGKMRNF